MATVLHIKCASIRKREWSKWKISASSQEIKIKEEKIRQEKLRQEKLKQDKLKQQSKLKQENVTQLMLKIQYLKKK